MSKHRIPFVGVLGIDRQRMEVFQQSGEHLPRRVFVRNGVSPGRVPEDAMLSQVRPHLKPGAVLAEGGVEDAEDHTRDWITFKADQRRLVADTIDRLSFGIARNDYRFPTR